MIEIEKDGLRILLDEPLENYRGVRFDSLGVFRRIVKDGYEYAGRWYEEENPLRHDNVCGPSEEFFGVQGYDEARVGEPFLKLGVGLLEKPSEQPYDWFRLYAVVDRGEIEFSASSEKAQFSQYLKGYYLYRKSVEIRSASEFVIRHTIKNLQSGSLTVNSYNHNFFTFSDSVVTPSRRIEFDGIPYGTWREDTRHGFLEGNKLCFDGEMMPSEKAYIGNLKVEGRGEGGYGFSVCEGERGYRAECSEPLDHMVMWSCRRVACAEPYIHQEISSGEEFSWDIHYRLF